MFDNMLQLMRFSVYFKGILNTDNGYFHIKILISAVHMLEGSWACSLRKFLKKKCNLVRFDVSLHTIIEPPPTISFACYMRSHSGPFLSFLAYYMGALSDQFLRLLWRPPYVFFFSYYMETPQIISLHTILGPPDHFLRLLYGAPQISFFSYNMGAPLRSVSLFTIWAPLRSVSLHAIRGPPQILISS